MRREVRKVGGVAHSLAWLTRLSNTLPEDMHNTKNSKMSPKLRCQNALSKRKSNKRQLGS
jgi:hypothetical protein